MGRPSLARMASGDRMTFRSFCGGARATASDSGDASEGIGREPVRTEDWQGDHRWLERGRRSPARAGHARRELTPNRNTPPARHEWLGGDSKPEEGTV